MRQTPFLSGGGHQTKVTLSRCSPVLFNELKKKTGLIAGRYEMMTGLVGPVQSRSGLGAAFLIENALFGQGLAIQ